MACCHISAPTHARHQGPAGLSDWLFSKQTKAFDLHTPQRATLGKKSKAGNGSAQTQDVWASVIMPIHTAGVHKVYKQHVNRDIRALKLIVVLTWHSASTLMISHPTPSARLGSGIYENKKRQCYAQHLL